MSSDLDASTESSLRTFITRQHTLLSRERGAEIERTSLLLTNCAPKLLEQKGLALGNLGVVSAGIGLGGKTCVIYYKQWGMINSASKYRLVELERPAAFHSSQVFPPHTFRCPFCVHICQLCFWHYQAWGHSSNRREYSLLNFGQEAD